MRLDENTGGSGDKGTDSGSDDVGSDAGSDGGDSSSE